MPRSLTTVWFWNNRDAPDPRRDGAGVKRDIDRAHERFPIIKRKRGQKAGTRSGGQRQIPATSSSLMSRPKRLLLDEPSLDAAPMIVAAILETIKQARIRGRLQTLWVDRVSSTRGAVTIARTSISLKSSI